MRKTAALFIGFALVVQLLGINAYASPMTEKKFYNFNEYTGSYNPPGFAVQGTMPTDVVLAKGAQSAVYGNKSTSLMVQVDASNADEPFDKAYNPYVNCTDSAVTGIEPGEKVYMTFKIAAEDLNFDDITLYTRINGSNAGNFVKIDSGGNFYHSNAGTTASTQIEGTVFKPRTWYTIEVVVAIGENNRNSLMDVYINGKNVASGKKVHGSTDFNQINSLRISANTKKGTKFYLDDIGYQVIASDADVPLIGAVNLTSSDSSVQVDNDTNTISCIAGSTYGGLGLSGGDGTTVDCYTDATCATPVAADNAVDFENAVAVVTTEAGGLFYYHFAEKEPEVTYTRYDFNDYRGQWNPANFNIAGTMPAGVELKKVLGDALYANDTKAAGFQIAAAEGQSPFPLASNCNPYMDCNDKISLSYPTHTGFYYSLKLAIDRPFDETDSISLYFRNNTAGSGGQLPEIVKFNAEGIKVLNTGTTAGIEPVINVKLKPKRWYNIETVFRFQQEEEQTTARMSLYIDGICVSANRTVNVQHLLGSNGSGGVSSLRTSVQTKTPIAVYIDDVTYEALTETSVTTLPLSRPQITSANAAVTVDNSIGSIVCAKGTKYGDLQITNGNLKIYTDNTYAAEVPPNDPIDFENAVPVVTTKEGGIFYYDFRNTALGNLTFYRNTVEQGNEITGPQIGGNGEVTVIGTMTLDYTVGVKNVQPMFALYNGGQLVDVAIGETAAVSSMGESVILRSELKIPAKNDGDAYVLKYLFWNSLGEMNPYAAPIQLESSYE